MPGLIFPLSCFLFPLIFILDLFDSPMHWCFEFVFDHLSFGQSGLYYHLRLDHGSKIDLC
jgi:hypothetical protein